MAVSRVEVVDAAFIAHISSLTEAPKRSDLESPVCVGAVISAREAIGLFEHQITSRHLDFEARAMKARGTGFYTIGASGNEGNVAVAWATQPDDMAFLHYRSGPFFLTRAAQVPGTAGALDVLLGMAASRDEPIAGGRHKVYGSVALNIPPQTSTIASQLPKAVGYAVCIDRMARIERRDETRISICTFGDASSNHSTATGAFNAAAWASHQRVPTPVLFVCEDNGMGISVRTPEGWVEAAHRTRSGITYFQGSGLDLPDACRAATAAVRHVRTTRTPAFLHLKTVRMLGHAGSDVEQLYRDPGEIEEVERQDPILNTANLLVSQGWMTPHDVAALYEDTRDRIAALATEAERRPHLSSAEEVMAPLAPLVMPTTASVAPPDRRATIFRNRLPESEDRPRHMAIQINRALHDLLAAVDEAVVFGEDVARKGGVYHVTAGLTNTFGVGRVFNTLLDEQTILGLAMGAGHAGLLPFPEVQYLAYLMNAIDQLRGEAGSMQFFSKRQYRNPMVIRIAGLAYQRGFGGHFHNDHGIAALLEIPGLVVGCPSRGDEAAKMLRTLAGLALHEGLVTVQLEPIALYMTKDLHTEGDGCWSFNYPSPDELLPLDEVGVYGDDDADLCVATYANGLHMSLRVAQRLRSEGMRIQVLDLRWLAPLPLDAVARYANRAGKLLVVDECRTNSGIAALVMAGVMERATRPVVLRRVTAPDTYIPLGDAANLVLVSESGIEAAVRDLVGA